ncbi:MAG: hypothetical protein A2V90_04285 [Gammaproteobacteria bacterium RBG_16_57_12]|nr:MAG: hypothetical protein A2V90_04285 [Gammaproteobacteria bacterium RBG_16_57_12]
MQGLIKSIYFMAAGLLLAVAPYAGAAQGAAGKSADAGKEAAAQCREECKSRKKEDGEFERCIVECMKKKESSRSQMPLR